MSFLIIKIMSFCEVINILVNDVLLLWFIYLQILPTHLRAFLAGAGTARQGYEKDKRMTVSLCQDDDHLGRV